MKMVPYVAQNATTSYALIRKSLPQTGAATSSNSVANPSTTAPTSSTSPANIKAGKLSTIQLLDNLIIIQAPVLLNGLGVINCLYNVNDLTPLCTYYSTPVLMRYHHVSLLDISYNNHIPIVFNLILFYLMGSLMYYNVIYVELLRIIIVLLEPTADILLYVITYKLLCLPFWNALIPTCLYVPNMVNIISHMLRAGTTTTVVHSLYSIMTVAEDENVAMTNCSYFDVESFNEMIVQDNIKKVHIMHHNIRSFHRNFDELSVFIDHLKAKFRIFVLTETWFSKDFTVDIDGYKSHHSFRYDRMGGGVSIYVDESLKSEYVDDLIMIMFIQKSIFFLFFLPK